MNALPVQFLNQMREMLGDEYPAFLRAMADKPALALRLNPRRERAEAAAAGFVDGAVPWEPLGRYLRDGAKPGAAIAHWAGAYYIQEASAMVSAAILDARPGERVLDLCAAPGGKSTQIAAAMDNRGLLVANDPEPARAKVLAGNLERMGAANAVVVNALPDRLARKWPETFDAILVDAPCSGEGMFRRDPAARDEWSPASPQGCAGRQAEILDCAARMLRPGGRLVYSTCTFNRCENEDTIAAFLDRHPEFQPENFTIDGLGPSVNGCVRVLPHRVRGDGHFAARLRKAGTCEPPGKRRDARPARPDPELPRLMKLLERDVCAPPDWLGVMKLRLLGDRLIAQPEGTPDLDGVRVVSPGLGLLRAGRSHVEPEHALAMALPIGTVPLPGAAPLLGAVPLPGAAPLPRAVHRIADLDDAQAAAYLAGETLPLDGARGWTLAAWHGMPLGWGKRSDGVIKNHLPKGLRRSINNG